MHNPPSIPSETFMTRGHCGAKVFIPMDTAGPTRSRVVPCGPVWSRVVPSGPEWSRVVPAAPPASTRHPRDDQTPTSLAGVAGGSRASTHRYGALKPAVLLSVHVPAGPRIPIKFPQIASDQRGGSDTGWNGSAHGCGTRLTLPILRQSRRAFLSPTSESSRFSTLPTRPAAVLY